MSFSRRANPRARGCRLDRRPPEVLQQVVVRVHAVEGGDRGMDLLQAAAGSRLRSDGAVRSEYMAQSANGPSSNGSPSHDARNAVCRLHPHRQPRGHHAARAAVAAGGDGHRRRRHAPHRDLLPHYQIPRRWSASTSTTSATRRPRCWPTAGGRAGCAGLRRGNAAPIGPGGGPGPGGSGAPGSPWNQCPAPSPSRPRWPFRASRRTLYVRGLPASAQGERRRRGLRLSRTRRGRSCCSRRPTASARHSRMYERISASARVLARELTKIHEDHLRGWVSDLLAADRRTRRVHVWCLPPND